MIEKYYESEFINYKKIARLSFILLIFFIFFGTSLPFEPKARDVDEISSANIVNQAVYTLLFLLSFVAIFPKRGEFIQILLEEKFLTIFIVWCTLSIFWSDYSFISFKRLFQIYTVILATMAFLLHHNNEKELLKIIKYIIYPYLIISIISVVAIPSALDPDFHTWRGLTSQKNELGQVGVASIIFCYMLYKSEGNVYGTLIAAFMILIALLLTLGSLSSTSILILLIIIVLGLIFFLDKIFSPLGINHTVSRLILFFITSTSVLILVSLPDELKFIPNLFGKDTSFSGRTDLWAYMMFQVDKHPLFGTGYQAFWVIKSQTVLTLYQSFNWLPNQSHNGYIDIWNELGIIGLSLFVLLIINYFRNLVKLNKKNIWSAFIIIALISNFQESSFFRPGQLLSSVVIISYLILFFELHWQNLNQV